MKKLFSLLAITLTLLVSVAFKTPPLPDLQDEQATELSVQVNADVHAQILANDFGFETSFEESFETADRQDLQDIVPKDLKALKPYDYNNSKNLKQRTLKDAALYKRNSRNLKITNLKNFKPDLRQNLTNLRT